MIVQFCVSIRTLRDENLESKIVVTFEHSWLELDAKALRSNYNFLQEKAGDSCLAPVLKSNAYGHGLKEIYEALTELKPQWLCVNYLKEAEELRKLGFSGRLLVVGPCTEKDLIKAVDCAAELTLGQEALLEKWLKLGTKKQALLHLKFDTGMARQGFALERVEVLYQKLKPLMAKIAGVSTHFANVEDVTNTNYAAKQLERLKTVARVFKGENLSERNHHILLHAASSASSLIFSESLLDLCRTGISLYGLWPSELTRLSYHSLSKQSKEKTLQAVLSWRAKISSIQELKKGDFVGYGCSFQAASRMRLGVVPVGYYEGYPRLAANGLAYVLIAGQRCLILGRVCMNMLMVDISHLQNIKLGEQVTLVGKDGQEEISLEDVAAWSQTIHYEVVTRLNRELPRILVATSKPL